ncbi:MAG: hypothetical protein U0796_01165 [Gemmatales bacterium]
MAGRNTTTTEMTIDSISVSPPTPRLPKWVLIDGTQSSTSKAKVARPYSERSNFVVGAKLSKVQALVPAQWVDDGYLVIDSGYVVTL